MIGNLANTISNIGLGAVQKATPINDDRDFGKALAQGLTDWSKFQKRKAYIDQLTSEHPEDAAKIAQDPEAYAKMLQDNANAERDQQYKLDILGQQFENALALEDKRNANAVGLQRLAQSIRAGEVNNATAQRLAALDEEFKSGRMSEENYNKAKSMINLGDSLYKIAYGENSPSVNLPEGVQLTGNDEYDKVILKDAAEKAVKAKETEENDERSRKQAQDSINQLASVADRNNIGVFTDWFRSKGLTGAQVEKDLGEISSAVAGLAPRAISNLKNAGVSGINSLSEFMTYIGLPQNPTSKQIAGAIPMMAQIAGVENPYAQKEVKNQDWSKVSNDDLLKGL